MYKYRNVVETTLPSIISALAKCDYIMVTLQHMTFNTSHTKVAVCEYLLETSEMYISLSFQKSGFVMPISDFRNIIKLYGDKAFTIGKGAKTLFTLA